MIGVIANAVAIVLCAGLGTLIGNRIPERVQKQIMIALALCVMVMGAQMGMGADEFLIVIVSMAVGTAIGTALDIDAAFRRFGETIDAKFRRSETDKGAMGPVSAGVQASILFCVGSMAIVGSLQAGMNGDNEVLLVKAALDGLTSVVFASTMGFGVALSAIPVLIYQGAITLMATTLAPLIGEALMADLTAVGGIMIFAIGLGLSEIKDVRIANMLPSFFLPILIRWMMGFF